MSKTLERLHDRLDWRMIAHHAQSLIDCTLAIQSIPAPTFAEGQRAAYVRDAMIQLELQDIMIDAEKNVHGYLPGQDPSAPHILITAHTDTVFAAETDLTAHHHAGVIKAPGIGDNSIGVAGLLELVRYLRTQHITPPCTLWFVATSREEGMGDLGGMKTAFARHATKTAAVINIEGQALGHVYNAGIAVRRLKIAASVEGGHSWLHFGRPSAIHSLVEIATKICSIRPPDIPRTTYNIGVIQGGTTINSIATHAEFWLDLRSESSTQLQALENQVRQEIAKCEREEVSLSIELVGDRPAGSIDKGHPLVVNALETLQLLGITPTLESASTDGNIPLAHGCPAVTIGITRGGNAHRTDEFIETEPVYLGLKQLILLTLTHAHHAAGVG